MAELNNWEIREKIRKPHYHKDMKITLTKRIVRRCLLFIGRVFRLYDLVDDLENDKRFK